MTMRSLVCALALSAAGAVPAFADFDDYKPSTLKEVWATDGDECAKLDAKSRIIDPLRQVFRAKAVWRGEHRPIEAMTAQMISWYGKSLQQPTWGDLFKDEVRVSDAGVDYWMPIQSAILPAFVKEVGAGGQVELYIAFFGCYPQHPVVGINEFQAAQH